MKFVAIFFICFGLSLATPLSASEELESVEAAKRWSEFKASQGKEYGSAKEESRRRAYFIEKDKKIQEHNSKGSSFQCAHNDLSDRSPEEIQQLLGMRAPKSDDRLFGDQDLSLLLDNDGTERAPNKLDLRKHKCMPAVKNQGGCGSCWAFTTIAPLEFTSCKKKKGILNLLSEQQLVDCAGYGGCGGGWFAYGYIQSANGSDSSDSYPYTATDGTCSFTLENVKATVKTYDYVPKGPDGLVATTTAMKNALNKYGPLSVAIMVQGLFGSYSTGVYDDPECPTHGEVNHGVVVVGYGTSKDGLDYWIVRNSWGANWGNKGYILMRSGINLCNIERYPMYVVAAS